MKTKLSFGKYRVILWLIGIVGAIVLAMFIKNLDLSRIIMPEYMRTIQGVVFGVGMLALFVIGYLLGKLEKE
jgi:hypothetical protein